MRATVCRPHLIKCKVLSGAFFFMRKSHHFPPSGVFSCDTSQNGKGLEKHGTCGAG